MFLSMTRVPFFVVGRRITRLSTVAQVGGPPSLTQVEQYDPYTIDYGELLPVNGFCIGR